MDMENSKQNEVGVQVQSYHLAEPHADERGWVLFPWKGIEGTIDPDTLHIVHVAPGATRGNHYHPQATEWICSIEGEGLLTWRSVDDGTVNELHLEAQRTCVRISPGVRHAVKNIGPGELLLVAVREKKPEGDQTVQERV